ERSVPPPPIVGATPAPPRDVGAKPAVGVPQGGPPVGARGVVEPSNGRLGRGDEVAGQPPRAQVAPPGQAPRSAQAGEGRPVPHGREAAADGRGGPKQVAVPGPRNQAPREVTPAVREAAAPPPAPAPHPGEQRMTRPEPPRNREQRKDEKGDERGEKQR
ncbi:MAG TPA: hypothetical protein VGH48_17110, partial [Caldimonas sp.]